MAKQPYHRRLAVWAQNHGYSAESIATNLETTPRTVYRWLSGEAKPGSRALEMLAKLGAPDTIAADKGTGYETISERLTRIENKIDQLLAR
jgi:hypothetical protein